MTSDDKLSRLSGILYVAAALCIAVNFGAMQKFAGAGPVSAVRMMEASGAVFPLLILSLVCGSVLYLLMAVAMYWRFKATSPVASGMLVLIVATGIPATLEAAGCLMDLLSMFAGEGNAPVEQAVAALRGYDNRMLISALFWGLWLFPLGWMMYCSGGLVPKILGVALVLGGYAYIAHFAKPLLGDGFATSPVFGAIGLVSMVCFLVGELGTMVWLVVMGAANGRK